VTNNENEMDENALRGFLSEHVEYRDGFLYWKKTISNKAKAGGKIGSKDGKGYLRFWMFKRQYSVHRVIFLLANGYMPACIDHIKGISGDNRIENLREATVAQNLYNQKGRLTSKSGFKGVHWHSTNKKWTASVRHQGRLIHLGSFDSVELASKARASAAMRLHGEFYNQGLAVTK